MSRPALDQRRCIRPECFEEIAQYQELLRVKRSIRRISHGANAIRPMLSIAARSTRHPVTTPTYPDEALAPTRSRTPMPKASARAWSPSAGAVVGAG